MQSVGVTYVSLEPMRSFGTVEMKSRRDENGSGGSLACLTGCPATDSNSYGLQGDACAPCSLLYATTVPCSFRGIPIIVFVAVALCFGRTEGGLLRVAVGQRQRLLAASEETGSADGKQRCGRKSRPD